MKIKILVLISFLTIRNTFAQTPTTSTAFTGKPRYQVIVHRDGTLLDTFHLELFPLIAPNHARNFDSLVNKKFYDYTAFHRVIPGFMIQGGDPNSISGPKSTWGQGQPTQQKINAEFSPTYHVRGILSMARSTDINSATSQFFICVAAYPSLNGKYSVFGHVTSGMNVVDTIVKEPRDSKDNPLKKIEMFITYTGTNDSVPSSPTLLTPLNGAQNIATNRTLYWNTVSDAILYRVEVSTDSLFGSLFTYKDAPSASITITGLQDSTKYFWRVKTNNGGKYSSYSDVWNFRTNFNAASVNVLQQQGYSLSQNIPNPVNHETVIRYAILRKENVKLTLFDIEGKEIAVLVNEEKEKGEYQFNLDVEKYSSGIYFYQIEAGAFSQIKKMILEK